MNPIETKDRILLYIARYGYLGYDDLVMLWASGSKNYLYKTMVSLYEAERPLVKKLTFATDPRYGQLPYLFALTRLGRDFLVKKYGLRSRDIFLMRAYKFHRDYWHRRKTIAVRIAIEHATRSAKGVVMEYLTYFDRMKPLCIGEKYYLPDSILHIRSSEPKDLIFCLEVHNGWNVKEIVSQLENHIAILQNGELAKRFGLPIDHRVLNIFEHPACMKRVLERIKDDPKFKYMRYYLLFKTYENITRNPLRDWQHMDSSRLNILGLT